MMVLTLVLMAMLVNQIRLRLQTHRADAVNEIGQQGGMGELASVDASPADIVSEEAISMHVAPEINESEVTQVAAVPQQSASPQPRAVRKL